MITFMGQPVAAPCPAKRVAGEDERSHVGLFIIVLTPQPPLSGGLRRRPVSLWYSGFPPDKGGKGGYLLGN